MSDNPHKLQYNRNNILYGIPGRILLRIWDFDIRSIIAKYAEDYIVG